MVKSIKIITASMTLLLGACMQRERNIENINTDSSIYSEDSYIDTISVVNGKVLGWRYDDGIIRGLFYSNRVITDDLSVRVKGGPQVFEFCWPGKKINVDFSDSEIGKKLKEINRPLKGVSRFKDRYTRDFGNSGAIVDFKICIDIPENPLIEDKIEELLIDYLNEHSSMGYMNDSVTMSLKKQKDIDIKDLSRSMFNEYNKKVKSLEHETDADMIYMVDVRGIIVSPTTMTMKMSLGYNDGGAHGMHNTNLVSFDSRNGQIIDNQYLFNEKDFSAVKGLLVNKIMSDPAYIDNGFAKSKDQLRHMFHLKEGRGNLVNGALGEDGIVFMFQPYEIAPYSEGVLSYTLSYDEVKPFLTEKALEVVADFLQ